MRALAGFLAYIVGVTAVIGLGIVALMALGSPIQQTPSAPIVAVASPKKPLSPSVKQTNVHHKTARTNQTHKMAKVIHKRTREVLTVVGQEFIWIRSRTAPYRSEPIFFRPLGQTRNAGGYHVGANGSKNTEVASLGCARQ